MLVKTVRSMFPSLTEAMLRRALRQRDFRVNGARTGEDVKLYPGDELAVYIDERYLAPSVEVVWHDARVAVINKPSGMEYDEAVAIAATALGAENVYPVHRLDAATCGLLAMALDKAAEEALLAAFRARRVDKTYRCVVKGAPPKDAALIKNYLRKDAGAGRVDVFDRPTPGALTAISEYKVIKTRGRVSLLSIRLHTGRTHQIRAQMAHLGCPVLGDDKYGDREFNRAMDCRRLRLCSCALKLHFPEGELAYLDGRSFEISAPFEEGFFGGKP